MENLDIKINILCARSHKHIAPHINGSCFNLDYSVIKNAPLSGSESVRKLMDTLNAYNNTEAKDITFYTVHSYALNAIGHLIASRILPSENVKVFFYGEKEDENFECGYTAEGWLGRPWRIGCLDWDYDEFIEEVRSANKIQVTY